MSSNRQLLLFNRAELIRCEPGTQAYADYIGGPRWAKTRHRKRRQVERKYGRICCEVCKRSDARCEVHHLRYDLVPHEPLSHLVILCPKCHDKIHSQKNHPMNPWCDRKSA